jgi:hypothetical protein
VFFENFHQHDAQAQEILNEVKKPRTSRAKKTVANDG